jgi:hypothetical protein
MPTKIFIPVVSASRFSTGKEEYFVAIVPIAKIPFDKFPMDANLRRASSKARVVGNMVKTLTENPQDFLMSNLGIVLIAEVAYFKYDPSGEPTSLYVEMLTGLHGVANGGHTLTAIYKAWEKKLDLSNAYVVIRANVGVTDKVVRNSVVNLNTAERVDKRSIFNKSGYFDDLKTALDLLGYKQINYYQNQAEAEGRREDTRQSILHVVKLLALVDRERFDGDLNHHPSNVVGGGSDSLNERSIGRAEDLVSEFLPVLVKIEKIVCWSAIKDPGKIPGVKEIKASEDLGLLLDGTPIPFKIPSIFAYPVIAAFRAFAENDKWQLPVDEILEDATAILYKEYVNFLRKEWDKKNYSLGGILRGEGIWGVLYNLASAYYRKYLKGKLAQKNDLNGRAPKAVLPVEQR